MADVAGNTVRSSAVLNVLPSRQPAHDHLNEPSQESNGVTHDVFTLGTARFSEATLTQVTPHRSAVA